MKPNHLALVLVATCVVLVTMTQPYAQSRRHAPGTITGLTDIVWSVKFSPDNRILAIARGTRDGGRVELWDIATGTLLHSIKGFDGAVWSISFTPDGKTMVSGSGGLHSNKISEKGARRSGTPFVELKWWDTESGELEQRVELPGDDRVSLVAVHSPDGRSLATLEYKQTVGFVNLATSDFGILPNRILSPMMSSVTYEASLRLLDARTGEVRLKLKGGIGGYQMPFFGGRSMSEMSTIYGSNQRRQEMAFSPDGQLVAAWSGKEIKLWSVATGEEVHTLKDFKGRLGAVTFSPDGRTLAAAVTKFSFKDNRPDFKSEVRTWDVASGTIRQVLPLTTQTISSLVYAPNGRQVIIGGIHHEESRSFATLELADLQTGSIGTLQAREEGNASSVVLSPDGQMIAFQTDMSSVHLIDTQNWKIKQTLTETSAGGVSSTIGRRFLLSLKGVMALAFSPDGRIVSGEIEQDGIKLWDARTGELKKQVGEHADTGPMAVTSLDGRMLADVSGDDEQLRLWNVLSGEAKDLPVDSDPVSAIALSPDGQKLAVAHANRIALLDTSSGTTSQKLTGPQKVAWLALAPDNLTLAAASEEGTLTIWSLASGQVTRSISGAGKTTALCFAPNSRTLASANADGSVSLWDLQTGNQNLQVKKHSGAVNVIAFSAKGNLMATGGDDRTVVIWENGKARRTLKGHDLAVTSLAFSPDAGLLASGAGNASVVLWEVATGKLSRVLR